MIWKTMRGHAAYYLGLCELIEPRLAASDQYQYAVKALDGAWEWVEGQSIPGAVLADLCWDEDDSGIGPCMVADKNTDLLPVWRCVDMAVSLTSLAASVAEGNTAIREDIQGVGSQASRDEFIDDFRGLIPVASFLSHYVTALEGLPDEDLCRSAVRRCAFDALHAAAVHVRVTTDLPSDLVLR